MIRPIRILALTSLFVFEAAAQAPQSIPNGLPPWAYNIPDKVQPSAEKITGTVYVPGSVKEYDAAAIAGNSNAPDWFPDEHGPAPRVVTGEAGSKIMACGTCHLMSGQGHPESADLAGLPAAYIVRQMEYFKSGVRKDDARMGPIAKATSDEDVQAAANYFAGLKPIPWVSVIETDNPPETYVSTSGRHRIVSPEGGTEPMGHRIIETPKDPYRTEIRDPHSPFLAYVPPGSIAEGKQLVTTGAAGKTMQCATCHGEGLKGKGQVPRIAGLQPLYIARQLVCIQNGSSNGAAVEPMKKVVSKLSEDDVIAISAYLGSLPPG